MKNTGKSSKVMIVSVLVLGLLLSEGCKGKTEEKEDTAKEITEDEIAEEIREEAAEQAGEESEEVLPDDTAVIYEPVLKEYREMVQNDFYRDRKDTDSFEESFGEYIGLEIRLREQDVYYAFHDIDGNGTEELLIAGGEHNGEEPASFPWNYDLYGYDGTKPVHIFPEMEFGYRTNYSLYEGVVEVFYSGSAAESGVDFYKIGQDGFSPELTASFLTVGHLEGDKPVFTYYQNDEEVTEEEYQSGIQSCEVPLEKELEWIQIQ